MVGNDITNFIHSYNISPATCSQSKQPVVPIPMVNSDVSDITREHEAATKMAVPVTVLEPIVTVPVVKQQEVQINSGELFFELAEYLDRLFSEAPEKTATLLQLQLANANLSIYFDLAKANAKLNLDNIDHYEIANNGLLIRVTYNSKTNDVTHQIIVPTCLRSKILDIAHCPLASGHLSVSKTRLRILSYFYWPEIINDIKYYAKTCHQC